MVTARRRTNMEISLIEVIVDSRERYPDYYIEPYDGKEHKHYCGYAVIEKSLYDNYIRVRKEYNRIQRVLDKLMYPPNGEFDEEEDL
jgi:hypothetical protein